MMVELSGVPSMQLAIYAEEVSHERLIFSRMQGPRLLDGSLLALSQSLLVPTNIQSKTEPSSQDGRYLLS